MPTKLQESWAQLQRSLQAAIAEVNAQEGVTKLGWAYTMGESYVLNANNLPIVNVSLDRAAGRIIVKTVPDHGWQDIGQWSLALDGTWRTNEGNRTMAELVHEICALAMRCNKGA